jgi:hypothetical protein
VGATPAPGNQAETLTIVERSIRALGRDRLTGAPRTPAIGDAAPRAGASRMRARSFDPRAVATGAGGRPLPGAYFSECWALPAATHARYGTPHSQSKQVWSWFDVNEKSWP